MPGPEKYLRYRLSVERSVQGLDGRGRTRAAVVVPASWKVLSRSAGSVRFLTPARKCQYEIRFSGGLLSGPDVEAATRVSVRLPGRRTYLQGAGTRDDDAWRVVRRRGSGGRRLDGLLAVRARGFRGLSPGTAVWFEVRAAAAALPNRQDCHAGFYRELLGPQLSDAFGAMRAEAFASRQPAGLRSWRQAA